jgi:pyruvate formate lyase activating enzyme
MVQIAGLQKTSLVDYPGKVATTVFLAGCDFRCHYCHNPELVLPDRIKNQQRMEEDDFFEMLSDRKKYIDAVCVTGGEPTLHSDLPQFIRKIKNAGFSVKLDTNGTNPEMVKQLISEKLIDYVAMDIKAPLERYEEITQTKADVTKIRKTIEVLRSSGVEHEFRTTVVRGLICAEDIKNIGVLLHGAKRYFLQQFTFDVKMLDTAYENTVPYSPEELKAMAESVKADFGKVEVRGI